jgi:outer membrane protein OmpA-like peptidoglycan-associated protein
MRNCPIPPLLLAVFFFLFAKNAAAQTPLEGYIFEENNRGYLRQAKVMILELPGNVVRAELATDSLGHFAANLTPGEYRLVAAKDVFFDKEQKFTVGQEKVFLKIEMQRKPGYLFDVSVAEARENPEVVVDAVQGAWIEIYNRTQKRPELVLQNHPNAFFQHTFEQGNHYTILVRKPGFIAKRIEVYVNVKGCILCVDGASSLTPGVTENLTAGNTMGTLITNIELERAKLDKRIQIQNIYYDFDKWDIRPDAAERLDHVVTLMNDNPGLTVELGSHTDSRGNDEYNMALSDKRAAAAVAYIVSEGVDSVRISSKGYGESQLVNRCKNGVTCSEEEHQQNRRTELRITGISGDSLEYLNWKSLEQIVGEEEVAKQNKDKKARSKPQKKAIPEEPATAELQLQVEEMAEAVPPAIHSSNNPQPARTPEEAKYWKEVKNDYSGFSVEIAQTDSLLAATDSAFIGFNEVFWQKDESGKYSYFAGNFNTPDKARSFFRKTVKPNHPAARLVRFSKGKKTYL